MQKLSYRLAQKSLNAVLLALEVYNKPICNYREENFCILMVNAYEMLFKAKIISENKENIKSIYVYEAKKNKNGTNSKQKIIKKNRIGQAYTLDIFSCMNKLKANGFITNNLKENIDILVEIRDNAIHLMNDSTGIKSKLYGICAASIKNYSKLVEKWFPKVDLNEYNFFITPLNFDTISQTYETFNLNVAQKNFLSYIELASSASSNEDEYDLFVRVDVKIVKSDVDEVILLKYAAEGKKINIEISEEMYKKMYPYTNEQIIDKIKLKNSNIKINKKFNEIKKSLQKEEICCRARYLDYDNKKGLHKFYYNEGFVNELLKRYE